MKLETDLTTIEELAVRRDDENWRFRSFLKSGRIPSRAVDSVTHEINQEVSSLIDCTQCAHCCKVMRPTLSAKDVRVLAKGLCKSVEQVYAELLVQGDEPGEVQFNQLPCPLLKDNRCSVYDHRPEACRSFPHLHKNRVTSRLWGIIMNYSLCPIVFNVYEQLKQRLNWRG
ncbi:MAG: YkgJ family cysteine cluster protein [Acidobacteriia bacterium]|nr:YkgJ family cysteine cluster protein [Terriglobia bacterium]